MSAHVSQVEGLGLLGGQIFRFLLCASPVILQGHTRVLLAMSSVLHYLPDRLLLEKKREMMTLNPWVIFCFILFFLNPLTVTSDPQCKLLLLPQNISQEIPSRVHWNPDLCPPSIIPALGRQDGRMLRCTFWYQRDPVLLQFCHVWRNEHRQLTYLPRSQFPHLLNGDLIRIQYSWKVWWDNCCKRLTTVSGTG